MGWRDRDYNQSRFESANSANPLLRFLFGSFPLGRYFGTDVRIHSTLILFMLFRLLSAGHDGLSVKDALAGNIILFGLVLMHEYGHCFGSRIMGGRGDHILLWPLGGLAFIDPPRRPWPSFVSTAAGPFVNLVVCIITAASLYVMSHFEVLPSFDPRVIFTGGELIRYNSYLYDNAVAYYLWWIFSISWSLFVFNMCLIMYPFDAGRMLQEILWPIVGYRKSMLFASIAGMAGAVILAMLGIAFVAAGQPGLILIGIAIFGFMTCYQTRMEVAAGMHDDDDGIDYSESLRPEPRRKGKRKWFRAAAKKAARERAEQAQIDAILAKVHEKGLHSLTWFEKRALKRATERQRQRDLAERL
jgi:hypothetical protein